MSDGRAHRGPFVLKRKDFSLYIIFDIFPLFLPSPLERVKQLMDKLIYVVPILGIVGLLFTFMKFAWVSKQDPGNPRMQEISTHIAEGAMAFLKAEWKILSYFVIIAAILLAVMGKANPDSH